MQSSQYTMNISVIVPVYNSEILLPELVSRVHTVLISLSDDFELILVNDGSRDNSWEVITNLAQENSWVRGINLMRNYGQHNALLCGIRAAQHEIVITMDDDLQHPPEEIPTLLQKITEGYDVVYGTPLENKHGIWRNITGQIIRLPLRGIIDPQIARNASAFRAFRRYLRDAFASYQSPFVSIDVLLSWGTTRFAAIPVHRDIRRAGVSNYTLRKLASHVLDMITGFSTWPLRVASLVGFGFTLFGIAVLVFVLGRYLIEGGSVAGFPFLASIVAIFSGAQLFALGIMGEYLARMHFRTMGRPYSQVRNTVGFSSNHLNDKK